MKDKELKQNKSHYKSFFKLKESTCDSIKLTNFIHNGQSKLYNIMNKIESSGAVQSQEHTNIVKRFFHRLRGDKKGSIKDLHFDKLFNVNLNRFNKKRKSNFPEAFKNKKINKNSSDLKDSNTIDVVKRTVKIVKAHPIKLFKTGAENLRKLSSINSNNSDSNLSLISVRQPLYITSPELKLDDNLEPRKPNSSITTDTFQSNRLTKTGINDIRSRFNESLRNLENSVYKKVRMQNSSLLIASDQSLFKNRIKRTNIIDNITNVEIPKIENCQPAMLQKKKFFSADYTQNEVNEIMRDIRLKGFYVTDRYNNKKYLSIDENHNAMTKDYYMNRISESSAMKYVNYVKNNYLTNAKKKYHKDNLSLIIHKEDIKSITIKNHRLYSLNKELNLRYRKLVNS
jgi:hypothetical protein